jgi:2-dehydro-3-deoxygalactonokinase
MNEYIAVDWGSTQLRGWRMRDGRMHRQAEAALRHPRLNGQRAAVFISSWRRGAATPRCRW